MSARGYVEGRRAGTPDAKLTDNEIKAEDVRLQTRAAKACRAHLDDLTRAQGRTSKQMVKQ
jgi:hypothetical protein